MILVNDIKFNDEEFHNGEVIFEVPEVINKKANIITLMFQNNKDITALMFAKTWLDKNAPDAETYLVMRYIPYSRMDRQINNQMFSMEIFADIINKMNFKRVYVLDPHSDVSIGLLERVEALPLISYIDKVVEDFNPDYICYPDKGAFYKYPKVLRYLDIDCFYGNKVRDLENKGRITEYELVNAPDLKGKKVLIIDDICCLGGTAYNAAKEMKLKGAESVAFYISHCEEGIYAGKILKKEPFYPDGSGINLPWAEKYTIDKVYTANTMNIPINHNNIKVII